MSTIAILKENAQAQTPLVLFTFTFADASVKRFSTHAVTYSGNAYEARILRHNFFEVQAMSEQGTDQLPHISLTLANADTQMSQLNATKGFKGAALVVVFVIFDLVGAVVASSDSWTVFNGICNAPDEINDLELVVSAVNRMNLQRSVLPPVRVQRRCPWPFPATAAQRLEATTDRNSIFYMCGYGPDVALADKPVGKKDGANPFTTCTFTRADCIARGMFNHDAATTLAAAANSGATTISVVADIVPVNENIDIDGNEDPTSGFANQETRLVTAKAGAGPYTYTVPALGKNHSLGAKVGRIGRRYGGIEFVPPVVSVRPFGGKFQDADVQKANYNDPIPLVYGTAWAEPPITALRNDGNLTKFECMLSFGEISAVRQVVVNGVSIPEGVTGRDMTGSGWWTLVGNGDRWGEFDLDTLAANAGNPQGDPYGSIAYLFIAVPSKLNDGKSLPQVQALVDGRLVETFNAGGASLGWSFSQNPVWILLDILKLARWKTGDLDLPTWKTAADFTAATITQKDNDGAAVSLARFRTNLVIRDRRTAADVVLGLRNNARLYFTYGSNGKLQCNVAQTIAGQQPSLPYGSNAGAPIAGGWPAYVYNDATLTILRREEGRSSLRLFHRPIADTPTRIAFEFTDEFAAAGEPLHSYIKDSFTAVDVDEQVAAGHDVSASPPVDGIPNYDQAARIGAYLLAQSVDGNLYIEFDTSVKALGQQVGHIIAVTYAKESWTNKLFRIIKVAPQQNFRRVSITAQAHDDTWFADTYGQDAPPKRRPRWPDIIRSPNPTKGKVAPPAAGPEQGTANDFFRTRDAQENWLRVLSETSTPGAEGVPLIRLVVDVAGPPQAASSLTSAPLVDLQPTIIASGGTLPIGTYYYAVAAIDSGGVRSVPGWFITAKVTSGAVNQVQLTGLKFDSNAASTMVVYRGRTPHTLIGKEVTKAATYTDNGDGLDWGESPMDPFFHHVNFYWRRVLQTRLSSTGADIFSATTIGNTGLVMGVNAHVDYMVEIVRGTGAGQRRKVTSNTATTLTVTPSWQTTPNATSVFIIHNRATAATVSTVTDANITGVSADQYQGHVIRIVSGTGIYQERKIRTHTATIFTIEGEWAVTPDTTSAFVISENSWVLASSSTGADFSPLATDWRGTLEVPNEGGLLVEYTALAADAQDAEAVYELSNVVRYAIKGDTQTPIITDTTGQKKKMTLDVVGGVTEVTWTNV